MANIAINGFGRIGRLFFRQALGRSDMNIVAINDLGDAENLAYLLRYDTVYGRYDKSIDVQADGKALRIEGKSVAVLQEKDPSKLPWADMQIDIVIEATGVFSSYEKSSAHLTAGAKKVVLTAPSKDADGDVGKTVLVGVNEEQFKTCKISSNGSCTTNASSPIAAIMDEKIGVEKAILNTVHGYTATQNLVDGPNSHDYRRGRAAAVNIVPSTTGAAIAVARAVQQLEGKFDGMAIRVPVVNGSLVDFTFIAKRETTPEEINDIFRAEAQTPRWSKVLSVSDDPIVSSDIIGEPYGAIIDTQFTKVVGGNLVKVLSWYDNEIGYVATLVEHTAKAIQAL